MSEEHSASGSARPEGTGEHDESDQSDEHFWAEIAQQIEVPLREQLAVKQVARGPVQSQRAWEIFNELKASVVALPRDDRAEEDRG